MPLLKELLLEVELSGTEKNTENLFNYALNQVYAPHYIDKINSFIRNRIFIKEAESPKPNIVAWNNGSTIFINKPVFYEKTKTDQIQYLLHEFTHVMQNKRNFMITKTFPELHKLGEELYEIAQKNLQGTMAEFLTGHDQKLPTHDEYEIVAYLMNGKIEWSALTNKGRKEFVNALYNSGIFNMRSNFWKHRINNA